PPRACSSSPRSCSLLPPARPHRVYQVPPYPAPHRVALLVVDLPGDRVPGPHQEQPAPVVRRAVPVPVRAPPEPDPELPQVPQVPPAHHRLAAPPLEERLLPSYAPVRPPAHASSSSRSARRAASGSTDSRAHSHPRPQSARTRAMSSPASW